MLRDTHKYVPLGTFLSAFGLVLKARKSNRTKERQRQMSKIKLDIKITIFDWQG